MTNYIATIAAIDDIVLSQRVSTRADISAASASDVGTYYVAFMLYKQNADGTWFSVQDYMLPAPQTLTQEPKTIIGPAYTPPSFGRYRLKISVRSVSNYAWQTVTQTDEEWSVTEIPTVNGFKQYVPVYKPPAEVGIVPLVKQYDGSYLPASGNWQMIPGMSIVDNSVLDTTKWRRKLWAKYGGFSDHLNDELQRYVDSGVDYQNGKLLLTATPRAGTSGHAPSPNGDQYPLFDSGMVRSVASAKFCFSHLRVMFQKQPAYWGAWWMIPEDGAIDPNPEMDMMEFVFNGANETANMIHFNGSGNKSLLWSDASYNTKFGFLKPDPTFYDADYWINRWVDICMMWDQDSTITMYHDGNPSAKWYFPWRFLGGEAVPATIMLNLAIGGNWPTGGWTLPVPSGPSQMAVQFLKTYTQTISKFGSGSPV